MFNPWAAYFESVRLAMQAQQVIALRTLRLSEGGPFAVLEAQRMVGEKLLAAWESQAAAGVALAGGRSLSRRKTLGPYRRAVRANHRRLTRPRKKR